MRIALLLALALPPCDGCHPATPRPDGQPGAWPTTDPPEQPVIKAVPAVVAERKVRT